VKPGHAEEDVVPRATVSSEGATRGYVLRMPGDVLPPRPSPNETRPHVVVVGAGFAGLAAVKGMARLHVHVTVVDARNHHLFQPLLYQVATASLTAADVATPIRRVLARQANTRVRMERVSRVDLEARRVVFCSGESLSYDALVLAPGSINAWFGHEEWGRHAQALKTVDDAMAVRQRILLAYERAENEREETRRRELLTFVIVGAGPTGVELAGAIAEMARHTLTGEFDTVNPRDTRAVLIDAADRVLPTFDPRLSRAALQRLGALGVEVRTGTWVSHIDGRGVETSAGPIRAATVIWAAGVRASPLLDSLSVERLPDGRVKVAPDLSLPGHPDAFVVGDAAAILQDGAYVPAMAPPAIQMGRHAARNVGRRLSGESTRPFRYADRGILAVIGRNSAVARVGGISFTGFPAWLLWVVVHIAYLIGFRNRLIVLIQWAWSYVTGQRSARLIFDESRGTSSSEVTARAVVTSQDAPEGDGSA
jgi:NADH:ubiquinone reductase (H+-translocating)